MLIKDIMTRVVRSVEATATLQEAAEIMVRYDIGALPVLGADACSLVGMVTDRDLATRAVAKGLDPSSTRVAAVMSSNVIVVYEDQDVEEAAWMMEIRHIRRLIVVDGRRRATGVVSLGDLSVRGSGAELGGEVLKYVSEEGGVALD